MSNRTIASALASSRLGVIDDVAAGVFDDIDLSSIMVYLIDVCSVEALPWLAEQFDVSGENGYDSCTTERQKRELIKHAIRIHRFAGTTQAFTYFCNSIGYTLKRIDKNINRTWCCFNLVLCGRQPDDAITQRITSAVEKCKSKRDILNAVVYEQVFDNSFDNTFT